MVIVVCGTIYEWTCPRCKRELRSPRSWELRRLMKWHEDSTHDGTSMSDRIVVDVSGHRVNPRVVH